MHDSHHEFHPSNLSSGEKFREELRFKHAFQENTTHRLDKAQSILSDALQGHGEETLTKHNFDKVTERMRKDPRWEDLHSAGPEFENALRAHLKIEAHE